MLISIILGIIIILKYPKYKDRTLILIGATWIFITSPYWPDAITVLMVLLFGKPLDEIMFFFFSLAFVPLAHITWIKAFTNLLYKEKKKIIFTIILIEASLFEILFIYFLIVNPSIIGVLVSSFYVEWAPFAMFYLIFSIIFFIATGILFVRESFKSTNKEIHLKGKILFIAFISFGIGTIMDIFANLPIIIVIISSIIKISAAFEFYIGFTLPNWIKKIFLKEV